MNNMKRENENARDTVAAIGIGAMIVFIALVLVAAVASAVIIQTGEKLQQNAQQTGSDTQQEIGGKISIITAWVCDQTAVTEEIVLVFETAAGSEPIADTSVSWTIVCMIQDFTTTNGYMAAADDIGVAVQNFDGISGDTINDGQASELDGATIADVFNPGTVYMIELRVGTGTPATECAPFLNQEHTLTIMVDGGGTTYEKISYISTTEGDPII